MGEGGGEDNKVHKVSREEDLNKEATFFPTPFKGEGGVRVNKVSFK